MEPLRVLHVVGQMNRGGIETLLMNILRNIDRSIIQFDFLKHRAVKGDYDDEITSLGGRIYSVMPYKSLNKVAYHRELCSFFNNHPEYTIIHSHINTYSTPVLRYAKRILNAYCIAHAHIAKPQKLTRRIVHYYYRRNINSFSDYRFACSPEAGQWIFQNAQFSVMRNGIETAKFGFSEKQRNEMRDKLSVGNCKVIGHIGRFNEQKNHRFMIEVFSQVCKKSDEFMLLLVGDGALRKEIQNLSVKLNVQKKVIFMGVRSDIPELLQTMDILLFPSLYEGLGIVLIEAQTSGLPCLASDRVPKESKATNLVEYVSLEIPSEQWADKIIEMVNHGPRNDRIEEVKAAGYDISENIRWLQEFYLARHREALEQKR